MSVEECSDDLSNVIETPDPTEISVGAVPPCPPCPPGSTPPPPGIPPPSPPTPPPPPGSLEVKLAVTAVTSDGDDGNISSNVSDGNMTTRWSKLGLPAWCQLDMGLTKTLSYVKIAWYRGETGRIYGFNIQTSNDASTWTTVYTGNSMGNTADFEMYNFPDVSCRYVRLNVTSNNQTTSMGNVYASVTEIELWGIGSGSEVPPPPPGPPPPGMPAGFTDTDGIKVLNTMDTSPGKFHRNIQTMNLTGTSWGSSSVIEIDAEGNGQKNVVSGLTYWAFVSREGSFASNGARNYTARLDWRSSTGSIQCGVSNARSRGYIASPNDTKNCEVTAVFRLRNVLNESTQHHHVSIKPRGDGHSGSNECTLQVGARHPYTSNNRGRHSDLYGVEYTHPNYEMQNVTFVSPFTSTNYPMIPHNAWFGMKIICYNVNNNQTVHFECWIDTNPVSASGTFNNNWQKVWVFEHSGTRAPTWAGPNCQLRCNLARDFDVAAYNIHEIVPPTGTSSTGSAVELAERFEYEENTGNEYPVWISQISEVPLTGNPNTFVPEDELVAQQAQQDGITGVGSAQTAAEWAHAQGIVTESDITTVEGETSGGSGGIMEKTNPDFISIGSTETTDTSKQYVGIKRLLVDKIPKPKLVFYDEGDDAAIGQVSITAAMPLPDEDDPIAQPTGLTRVTNSLVLMYNAKGRVTKSVIVKYNVTAAGLTRVTRSTILKYNIRGRIVRSTIIKYNIAQSGIDQFSDVHFGSEHWD